MKITVGLELDIDIPEEICDCDAAMKSYVLLERRGDVLEAMRFTAAVSSWDDDDDDPVAANGAADNDTHSTAEHPRALQQRPHHHHSRRCRPGSSVRHDINQKLRMLDTISQVQRRHLQMEEAPVLFGVLLDALLDLMNSEYGFIGEVMHEDDGTMFLQTKSVTNIAWNDETRAFYEENIANGLRFYNMNSLFGSCMTGKRVVISNDPKNDSRACGIPKGHPPLDYFLGIPFFDHGCKNMVGMLAIANRPGGYSQEDVEFLEPFVATCSNLIQAYNAIQENARLINTLEEKVAERTNELSLANASLEEANVKVLAASAAQLTHFACMSHEIRTPLNCIVGLSSLLQETELTEKQQESLRMINTSGELLCTVVNDILDYSKLQSGNVVIELRETKLQEILDSVVNSFEHKARSKNIDFKIAYAPSVPDLIETDSNRLQQILYNLLGNAIKFSEPGGSIEFTVEMIIDQDKASPSTSSPERTTKNQEGQMVETGLPYRCPFHRDHSSDTHSLSGDSAHSCESDSLASSRCPFTRSQAPSQTPSGAPAPARLNIGTLRFTVKDFGRGIDAADFERIFEPFGQVGADTSRVYGGTGLGLAITLKLVERLGGKIGVESEVGKWSKFTIDIPLAFRLHPSLGNLIGQLMGTGVTLVEKGDECNQSVFDNLGLAVARFDSCQAMCDWFAQAGRNKALSPQICLIHEDLYIPDEYRRFAETTNATALVTFGPEHKSIPESRLHLRSITDRIPLVLLKSLVALRHHDQDVKLFTARRTPRMDALVDVLVVEDNLINQRVICKMLQRLGIERIDIANNGQEAVDMTATKHYGAIFMDMQMPIMCGDEACRIILDRYQGKARRPKVAFVSADVSSSFVSKATAAGAEHFLSKPFNVKAFERFIRTLQL